MKYKTRPSIIEAITFSELVEHGIKSGANMHNGMPWSFEYKGHAITHENDQCYLIPTKAGTVEFTHTDMLMVLSDEIYPCNIELFREKYEPA